VFFFLTVYANGVIGRYLTEFVVGLGGFLLSSWVFSLLLL